MDYFSVLPLLGAMCLGTMILAVAEPFAAIFADVELTRCHRQIERAAPAARIAGCGDDGQSQPAAAPALYGDGAGGQAFTAIPGEP